MYTYSLHDFLSCSLNSPFVPEQQVTQNSVLFDPVLFARRIFSSSVFQCTVHRE